MAAPQDTIYITVSVNKKQGLIVRLDNAEVTLQRADANAHIQSMEQCQDILVKNIAGNDDKRKTQCETFQNQLQCQNNKLKYVTELLTSCEALPPSAMNDRMKQIGRVFLYRSATQILITIMSIEECVYNDGVCSDDKKDIVAAFEALGPIALEMAAEINL